MRHNYAAKEWGTLGDRALIPSAITYEPKINSRTVQEERTGALAPSAITYKPKINSRIVHGGEEQVQSAAG